MVFKSKRRYRNSIDVNNFYQKIVVESIFFSFYLYLPENYIVFIIGKVETKLNVVLGRI